MKKILYSAAVASLLITSCQKTEVFNVVEDTIEFSTEVGKLTKAYTEAKYETLTEQGFRVWAVADYALDQQQKGQIYSDLKYLPVIYNNTNDSFDFDNKFVSKKYLWPQAGNYLYFYTISSAKAKEGTWLDEAVTSKFLFNNEKAVTEVEFPEYIVSATAHDDIMVADYVYKDKSNRREVSPNFRHTMTKVEFNFKKGGPEDNGAREATNIILKNITTTPLYNKGNLKITYSQPAVTDGNGNVTTAAVPFSSAWTPITGATVAFSKEAETLMTIAKSGGNIINKVNALSENPTEAAVEVIYSNENKTASVYETVETVTIVEEKEVKSYSWPETATEVHTYETVKVDGKDVLQWKSNVEKPKYETLYGQVLRTETKIAADGKNKAFDTFVTWYMIPQTLNDASLKVDTTNEKELEGAVVTITYVADGKTITQNFDLNVSKDNKDWNEEHCVRYNVTIAPHKIDFKPTVDQWTENGANMNN